MTQLYESRFERSLDAMTRELLARGAGTAAELWVFEPEPRRRLIERRLAATGVAARVRSAFKPLLHVFLEEVDREGLGEVEIAYPVHHSAAPNRFLLECYPLAGLLDGVASSFRASKGEDLYYELRLHYLDGRVDEMRVFAPNRLYVDHAGEEVLAPTGWLRLVSPGAAPEEHRVETEFERIFAETLRIAAAREWGDVEPFFDRLLVEVGLPADDTPLGFGEEVVSFREALHEDLYFSLLELFQKKTGRELGDRGIRPGMIVPDVRMSAEPSLSISIGEGAIDLPESPGLVPLAESRAPLSEASVHEELARIEGRAFEARSREGRVVKAVYRSGTDAAVMISGGQHANETTGVVGALRAARELARRPGAHFSVSPLENPDGYALHHALRAANPAHMHHAARYTAFGNDLEYHLDDALYERELREKARELTGALFHINLHGYPSHEWTRPLTGYVPRGFASWMLPHGFYLVMRHHPGWGERAARLVELVTWRLAAVPGLRAFTESQLQLYETHTGAKGFELVNGFPCDFTEDERTSIPLRLITEYPDETIGGEAFLRGHSAQMEAVLAAYEAFQVIMADEASKGSAS
ncbi:MAG: hypothetical protein M0001_13210 [Treponema sp.]|nr:hypothetical protein [Treponema sp.]